tara:strand:+ start:348 stop:1130 length:783 start_codon:yes stop_codon:yes gene_type:complete
MMEERYNFRLNTKGWGKIASPWFTYKQVDQTDAKECSICWDECTSYLYCANSEEHIVCKDCSKEIIVNTAFVNPDASIDINWKCPICRHDNEIGSWQFLPSTVQIKAKEAQQQAPQAQQQAPQTQQQAPQTQQQAPQTQEQQAQQQARQAQRQARARAMAQSQAREREIHAREVDNRLSRIDENAPSKFRWVLSLDWRNSIVNHFKAWIMYISPNYVENRHNSPPAGAELTALKEEHHYEERKRSPHAPWFNFLERTSPP